MGGDTDAHSRLRSIVSLKEHANERKGKPGSTAPLPAPRPWAPQSLVQLVHQSERVLPQHTGPDRAVLDTRTYQLFSLKSWKLWVAVNLVLLVGYIALTHKAPTIPPPKMELLELLQLTEKTQNRPMPNWKDADHDKKDILRRALEAQGGAAQPRPPPEVQDFARDLHELPTFRNYHHQRQNCTWSESLLREKGMKQEEEGYKRFDATAAEREFTKDDYFTYKFYASTSLWERFKPDGRNSWCEADGWTSARGNQDLTSFMYPDIKVEVCQFDETGGRAARAESWEAVRIGPMRSHGGHDWHSFVAYDVFPRVSELLRENKAVYVTGFFAGPIDTDAQPIEDPPMRIHDLQLSSTSFQLNFPNRNPFVRLHEDSGAFYPAVSKKSMNNETFNTETYSGSLTPDHAFPIYYPIQLVADLNDVRVNMAPEMEWYLELGLRYTVHQPRVQTARVTLASPGQVYTDNDMKHWSNDIVYWIPPHKTSMTWFTGFHQQPGRLMHGQFHSHQKYFEAAYVFSGSPESLGLNQGEFQVDYKTRRHFFPEEHGLDSDDVKLLLLYNALKSNSTLRCIGLNNMEIVKANGAQHKIGISMDVTMPHDRLPQTHCMGTWDMKRGEQWTVVAFNRPMCYEKCAGVAGPGGGGYGVPQQTIFSMITALVGDPVRNVRGLGDELFDHYQTFGANNPKDAFTASATTDVVTAMQTANLMSGYFPPDQQHHHMLKSASKVHGKVDAWRRNLLLDEICTA